ncbi:MAG: hypothetical protein ABEL51_13900 [Salinibacter sp.]
MHPVTAIGHVPSIIDVKQQVEKTGPDSFVSLGFVSPGYEVRLGPIAERLWGYGVNKHNPQLLADAADWLVTYGDLALVKDLLQTSLRSQGAVLHRPDRRPLDGHKLHHKGPQARQGGPGQGARRDATTQGGWANPLQGSTGIEGVAFKSKVACTPQKTAIGDVLEGNVTGVEVGPKMSLCDSPACNEVDTGGEENDEEPGGSGETGSEKPDSGGPDVPLLVRKSLRRSTCERETRQLIFEYVPGAREDKVLFRWCAYALWTNWRDQTTHRRVIHHKILHWIGHHRFDTAEAVLNYVKERLPEMKHSDTWAPGQHTRQIISDGLPEKLWKAVSADLDTPPCSYNDRVYVLSGDGVAREDAGKIRGEIEREIEGLTPPSPVAERIWNYMNGLPSRRFSRFDDKIEEAIEYVSRMEIDMSVSPKHKGLLRYLTGCERKEDGTLAGNVNRYRARLRHEKRKLAKQQRVQYKQILHQIAHQHKPYYKFSRQDRTDRIFSQNASALMLPAEVREILCEGLYDVDLRSAHLFIAAWLWSAEGALETLTQEGYCIWEGLMEHCRPLFEDQGLNVPEKGDPLYEEVKAGMKIMVYSTVYGMPAPSIQANVTQALKPILGPEVGEHLKRHEVITRLIGARDEKLKSLKPGDTVEAPTGIEIEVEVSLEEEKKDSCNKAGPKSCLATQAQAYEQELMSVLIDVAKEREDFRPLLRLHDGAACVTRRPNGLEEAVNEGLTDKQRELTKFAGKDRLLPAVFEVEKIEAPEMPPESVHDRIASAGGGAVRLEKGETAVKVDPETGRESDVPAGTTLLLGHEHKLYRIADTYIRVTDDGYARTTDPYPQDKLWRKTDSNSTTTTPSQEISTEQTATFPDTRGAPEQPDQQTDQDLDPVVRPHLENKRREARRPQSEGPLAAKRGPCRLVNRGGQ